MKKITTILLLIFGLSVITTASAQDEQLNAYLTTAAENNPGLKAKFSGYMAALEKVPQVGSLPDPTVAFAFFIMPVETRLGPQQFKISANQMFPWFGTLGVRSDAAESQAKAKYEEFEEAKSRLFYEVKSTYYNAYFNQRAIAITKDNLEILDFFRGLAQSRIEAGTGSSVDAYRLEMEWNDLQNQLALLQDNSTVWQSKFNALLNQQSNTSIQLPDTLMIKTLLLHSAIADSIRMNNHALLSYNFQIESFEEAQSAARKEGLPQISVGIDYTFIGKGEMQVENAGRDAFLFPKIGLSIPLYRNKYNAKVQEAMYMQEATSYQQNEEGNALNALLDEIWRDYSDAIRRKALYQKQTALAKNAIAILEVNYRTGHADFEQILAVEQKLLKYALELEKAQTDRATAEAFMDYLQGK